MAFTFGSLFSGVGGMDLGLERAGMECRWQVESNEYCTRVLAKHWPNVKRYGDIRTVDTGELERVDLICGGFPCQPVSVAGRQLAQADERWLWPEYARLVRALRPRFVLVENVPGLLVRGFGDVLGDLAALGYDTEWDCLSASMFGAAHLRERVFVLAYANTDGMERRRDSVFAGQAGSRWAGSETFVPGRDTTWEDIAFGPGEGSALISGDRNVVPNWMDRVGACGNAVAPAVATWLGERIMSSEGLA